MEEQLGAELFQRRDKGLVLTETGTSLLTAARAMRLAAHEIELRAAGRAEKLDGTVRLSASVAVAVHHLPTLIATARVKEPMISLELVSNDLSSNLHFREADIAVRMYRPTQLDLVTLHLGDLKFGLFASRGYIARRGMPKTTEDLLEHDVIGMDKGPHIIEGFRRAGFEVSRDWFKVKTDDTEAYWALLNAGCGIGFGQKTIGRKYPDLQEITLDLNLPLLPVWLTAHETVLLQPRVRRIWDILSEGFSELCESNNNR
jgi:DNA-binding transcriptional LysR family regulator